MFNGMFDSEHFFF